MIYIKKEITSEEEIIEIIKYKQLNEIKEFFKVNNIEVKQLNYLKNVVIYLIEKNFSFEIIKFLIKQQQKKLSKTTTIN